MVTVDKAKEVILGHIKSIADKEEVPLLSCLGRVLAEDIRAPLDLPSFDNSAMDGFALKFSDTKGVNQANPKILEVIEDVPAGKNPTKAVKSGQCIRIMTGAPMPQGADSVIMVEDTEKIRNPSRRSRNPDVSGKSEIRNEPVKIFKEVKKGENVRKRGEDVRKGNLVLREGALFRAEEVGLLAGLGKAKIKVRRPPLVGILATGDELIEPGRNIRLGKLYNVNSYSLYGQVIKSGGIPLYLGIAADNKKELREKIIRGMKADMLLVSGGVSVGDYDFVKAVLKDLGTQMKFWRVAMRPGKPLAFGTIKGKPVFGLPGNIVSSLVAFELFVRPSIMKMSGRDKFNAPQIEAILGEDIPKKTGFRYFYRVRLEKTKSGYTAFLSGKQGSGILSSLVKADGLIVLPENISLCRQGETFPVILFDAFYQ